MTIRFIRQAVWCLAAAGFLTASLHLAAPLHAVQGADLCHPRHDECPKDPSGTDHDADKCSVCHFLFGTAGKTLAPQAINQLPQSTRRVVDVLCNWNTTAVSSEHRIIPRAPPVA